MANVIFKQGTRNEYDAITVKDSNTLYWLYDTLELYKGNDLYATGKTATTLASGLMSAADKEKLDGLSRLSAVDPSVIITSDEDGSKIGVQLSKVSGNALEIKDDGLFVAVGTGSGGAEFTIEEQEPASEGYAKTYKLKRTDGENSSYIGDEINIPKDAVLSGGTFKIVETVDEPYTGAVVGDPYVDLTVANSEASHIYIPMKGLVDTVAAGVGISVVNNIVSIKLSETGANGLNVTDIGLALAEATTSSAGAMSAEDKTALYEIKQSIVWGSMGGDAES